MYPHWVHQKNQRFQTLDLETRSTLIAEMWSLTKNQCYNKAQGGASDSSADTQEKGVEFSESSKRLEGSEEDSLDSDGDEQEATQEQPRPLRWSVRVTVPPIRQWKDYHVSFTLVTET